jgi:excisionase family DNA binding protein
MATWLTVKEAAAYLKVSRATLYRWMAAGIVPYYAIATAHRGPKATRRFRQEDLDAIHVPAPHGPEEQV